MQKSSRSKLALLAAALSAAIAPPVVAAPQSAQRQVQTRDQALAVDGRVVQRAPAAIPGRAFFSGYAVAAGNPYMSVAELVKRSTYRARKAQTHRRVRKGYRGRGA